MKEREYFGDGANRLSAVPDTLDQIREWANSPVLCSGTDGRCGAPAVWMVRGQSHNCKFHDGRFFFKCNQCLDVYADKAATFECHLDHKRYPLKEIKKFDG